MIQMVCGQKPYQCTHMRHKANSHERFITHLQVHYMKSGLPQKCVLCGQNFAHMFQVKVRVSTSDTGFSLITKRSD